MIKPFWIKNISIAAYLLDRDFITWLLKEKGLQGTWYIDKKKIKLFVKPLAS